MTAGDLLRVSFFEWCMATPLAVAINRSSWAFAAIETVHIIALTVLLGTTLAVDLRLLGIGMRQQPAARLAAEFAPWTMTALLVMLCTGVPMFMSQAVRYSHSVPFFYKMALLLVASTQHFTIHRKAAAAGAIEDSWFDRLAGCLSLICWFGVALAGRSIAFI